jgi:hypothetical protein
MQLIAFRETTQSESSSCGVFKTVLLGNKLYKFEVDGDMISDGDKLGIWKEVLTACLN